jgi:hypothetical protein
MFITIYSFLVYFIESVAKIIKISLNLRFPANISRFLAVSENLGGMGVRGGVDLASWGVIFQSQINTFRLSPL